MIVETEGRDVVLRLHVTRNVLLGPQPVADVAEDTIASRLLPNARDQVATLNIEAASVTEDAVATMLPHSSKGLKPNQAEVALILQIMNKQLLHDQKKTKKLHTQYLLKIKMHILIVHINLISMMY